MIVSVSPKDVELLEEGVDQSYQCSISATREMITAFLTGEKSGEDMIALKSEDFIVTQESQSDGFRLFTSAFDFSSSNFRAFKLENGYELDNNEIDGLSSHPPSSILFLLIRFQ